MLDHHGWGAIQPELNRLSKQGKWLEMLAHIGDDILDAVGVSGTPAQVASELVRRYDFADRLGLILYNESAPEAVTEVVAAIQANWAT